MSIEHIEWQLIAALGYLVYALIMLAGKRTAWQKRKVVLIGFTPALLAGLFFVAQYLLEFAYMDTYMPPALIQAFTTFYANASILMFLTGLIAVGYMALPVTAKSVQELANTAKQTSKYQVNSEDDCIDASSNYLRKKKQQRAYEREETRQEEEDERRRSAEFIWDYNNDYI